jgi:hypothetical protein
MKIAVALPAEPQHGQAGVRIRYLRLAGELGRLGHSIECIPIDRLADQSALTYDGYIISKVYDARAELLCKALHRLGMPVGIDLFDDYFSQSRDARLGRLRQWLTAMVPCIDFVLCSTPRMVEVARKYAPSVPIHLLSDPSDSTDASALAKSAGERIERAYKDGLIRVAWFGMGDNPSFSVGLSDLAAWSEELDRMRGRGFEIELSILTNRRAMTATLLAGLRQLSLRWEIDEWSESGEQKLLTESTVAFLPVNTQAFSIAKSQNRVVTALRTGTQVISVGYPLYQPFDRWIYRDGKQLIEDLKCGKARLSRECAFEICEYFEKVASVQNEAVDLTEFIASVQPRGEVGAFSILIHGYESKGDIHKFTRRQKALSVASPLAVDGLNYDVRIEIEPDDGSYQILVSTKQLHRVAKDLHMSFEGGIKLLDTTYMKASASVILPELRSCVAGLLRLRSDASICAAYADLMRDITLIIRSVFPSSSAPVFSEISDRLPLRSPNVA